MLRKSINFASYIFVFLWTSFSVFGQCPTIAVSNPPPICDASGFTFADLNAFATNNGNGIVWYSSSTGGSAYQPSQLVKEGTYYVDDSSGSCGSRSSIVISFEIKPSGKNLTGIYCSKDNATIQTYIDDVLQSGIPTGGYVKVYYDYNLTNQASPSDAIASGGTNYYVVFGNSAGCESQQENGPVGVFISPADPTPASVQEFCSSINPVVGNLDPGTTSSSYNWYANVDALGNPIPPALSALTSLVNGKTYYVQVDDIFCESNTIPVTVTIDTPVNAGTPTVLQYCSDNLPAVDFNLFDELGGVKDISGTWSGPLATYNGYQGTVNVSSLTVADDYVFTYTVPSTGICPDGVATVTIRVNESLSSGTALGAVTFCDSTAPTAFDLFSLLENEDPNGQWTQGPSSSGTIITSPVDLFSLSAGTYNFTYSQNVAPNACPLQTTTVQIIILEDPNAGEGTTRVFCENDLVSNSPFDLITSLDGSQDNDNGIWTDANNTTLSNPIDITTLTVEGSPYIFNYTIDNGTCTDTTSSTIIVEPSPESGTVNAPAVFCEGSAPTTYDLFELLSDEDQTGVWYLGNDNLGSSVSNPIDVSGLTPGDYYYTYEVNAIGNCEDELVTVTITINPLPNTGVANNPPPFCENDAALNNSSFDLFTLLTGTVDSGGQWYEGTNTSGAMISNVLDLNTLTNIQVYNYTYSVTDSNGCENSTTVSITIEEAPNAGTTTNPNAFCMSDITPGQTLNLLDYLSVDADAGVWLDSTPSNQLSGSIVTLDGLAAGNYTFTFDVNAIGSCDAPELPTVQITINPLPNTGVANNPPPFCENDAALNNSSFDLFTLLTGTVDSGGQWYEGINTSGTMISNIIDLNTLTNIQIYNYTYSVTDSNGCENSTTVSITIEEAPNAGTTTNPNAFCMSDITPGQTLNLLDYLSADADAGVWLDSTPSNQLSGSIVTLDGLAAGNYTFTFDVNAIGNCDAPELPTVEITINPLPNTGTATPATFCENELAANSPLILSGLLTGADLGGVWSDDNSTGALSGEELTLTNLVIGTYNFTYTITDANGCINSSTVVVTIEDAPESGTAVSPMEVCLATISPAQTVDLFDLLEGEDQLGTWNDDDATGVLSGNLVTISGLSVGTYNFTYNVDEIGSCDDELVTVTIVINDTAAPLATAIQEFCDSANISNLIASGNDIKWYDEATGGSALAAEVALVDGETYYATQTDATTGCESSVRTLVTAVIYKSPVSGVASPISVCNSNMAVDLFTALDGSQDTGGVWQDTDSTGALTGSNFDATAVATGIYQFTYVVTASAPCIDASTLITVTVEPPLSAGTGTILEVCSNSGTTDLFALLVGADAGGTWLPALASGTGVFDPLVDASTKYVYTVINACGIDASEVDVTVTLAPNAGVDNAISICRIDGQIDLFELLGTSAQSGGTWSPLLTSGTNIFDPNSDASGVYRYTVAATAPCSPDAFADITVTINDSPQIVVLDDNPEFCKVDEPTVADLSISIRPTGTVIWYADADLTTPVNLTDDLVSGADYFATQTTSSGCESSQSVKITPTVNDTSTPTLVDSFQEYCINDHPTIATLTDNIAEKNTTSSNIKWYDDAANGSEISSSTELTNLTTYYAAIIDETTGCESSVRLAVTPDLTSCGLLVIPDGFSPNGDGVNDTFYVDNLNILYPNFEMEIYNRYGNIVYKGNASSPQFDGKSNQSRSVGSGDLPVGVYFYIFNFNDGSTKPKQGRLYLSR